MSGGRNMNGEFPLWLKYGDVEMLYDMMQYGLTRMVMGGEKNSKESVERFRELFEQIKAMSPLPEEARNRGASSFFDAFRAVETCDAFEVVAEKVDNSLDEATLAVLVHEAGEVQRFDLTRWLKMQRDERGKKDARPPEEIFSDHVEKLAGMLVEVSPVYASRIVEFRARLQVPEEDWTWGDKLRATMQTICSETFGEHAEYRGYDFKSRGDDFPGHIDIDVTIAAPSTLESFIAHAAERRTEALLEETRASPAP